MRVLITGASSFTGLHIIQALSERGVSIVATATGALNSYSGLKMDRLNLVSRQARIVEKAPFGSPLFLRAISQYSPTVLIHHGAMTTGYRHNDFNVEVAVQNNSFELEKTVEALVSVGGQQVWLTGSVFQGNANDVVPISPYGRSKHLTAKRFSEALKPTPLTFSQSILPNPFGAHDNGKLCDYLFDQWSIQQKAVIKTPNWVRDNIFVDLLSKAYADVVCEKCVGRFAWSGFKSTMWAFAQKVALETHQRTGWDCQLLSAPENEDSQPEVLVNTDPARVRIPNWSETKAWDNLIHWQLQRIRY